MVRIFILLVLLFGAGLAEAQPVRQEAPLYYAADRPATMFREPDSTKPYVELDLAEPVRLLGKEEGWLFVRTKKGATGYVAAGALSNVWIRVDKREQMVYLYRGTELEEQMPADFSQNTFSDKVQRGHRLRPDDWRTPEGYFYVIEKNPASRFYRALVLNYPTAEDARRGLTKGIISKEEYEAIARAAADHEPPPMDTALGGLIEIHGHGSGRQSNWTQGCVAVKNSHIRELWRHARIGTPVVIE